MLDQVRRGLRHAPQPERGAKATALATERHKLVVAAVDAAHAQEAVRQNSAFEERVEPESQSKLLIAHPCGPQPS